MRIIAQRLSNYRRRYLTHVVASHCKPWRDATNQERLDGENGFLLTPSIDHLFDRKIYWLEDSGRLIISPVAHRPSLQRRRSKPPRR
ncbi:HNH endonuclease [Hyphomicrobium denitrificans]|uniref:HNH endonuclease n=1 Tax=Hyphomicrobium denitrificans TaxID=53399 RepID=UPI003D778B90